MIDLSIRNQDLIEKMDEPECDKEFLLRTYSQFRWVNAMVAGWRNVYKRFIRPHLSHSEPVTFLDIGCGACDVPLTLMNWMLKDGFDAKMTGIDANPTLHGRFHQQAWPERLQCFTGNSFDLREKGLKFDFVISNHLLHHQKDREIFDFLNHASDLARRFVIFNDIERSRLAYALFKTTMRPFFHRSFIIDDGLISIRRSFTRMELADLVPQGWQVHPGFPFRLVVVHQIKIDKEAAEVDLAGNIL
jgi:2-polyprenyl-3-methyl-5-hydroxy-6-metoxy-1,4-benzoquinol methylase